VEVYFRESDRDIDTMYNEVTAATEKKCPGVWRNEKKLELIKSFCLSRGAEYILEGDIDMARSDAFTAKFLEQVNLRRTKALVDILKVVELLRADEHTLVSYFRKRIPCSCLDQKYTEVKSIKKMGLCLNFQCSHPGRLVERSTMLSCARCRWANYCSQECQTQHWTYHKKVCHEFLVGICD